MDLSKAYSKIEKEAGAVYFKRLTLPESSPRNDLSALPRCITKSTTNRANKIPSQKSHLIGESNAKTHTAVKIPKFE